MTVESGGPTASIDLGGHRRNLELIGTRVAPSGVMAVVKADGYGHGLLPMARSAVAAGIRWLGSLDVATALDLRAGGIDDETAVFAWLLSPTDDLKSAIDAGVDLGVSTVAELEAIARAEPTIPARVHLKIDTGLHRNGASPDDWPGLVTRAVELETAGTVDLVGVWSHISEASDDDDTVSITRFHDAIALAQAIGADFELRHLAASAASFARADARFDLVRVGAFGYGIAPGGGVGPARLGLTPVMTLSAPVLAVSGGYATLGIGYGHGISSAVVETVPVAIDGIRHPIVSIDRDSLRVMIGETPVVAGERALLWGPGTHGEATLQEWADALGTIGEELVTRLSDTVARTYTP